MFFNRHNCAQAMLIVIFVLLFFPSSAKPQDRKSDWQRVITGEGFNIFVDKNSLVLLPDNGLSAKYKTELSKLESMGGKSGSKYKTRLETIQFSAKKGEYLVSNTVLLDSSGKIVSSSAGDNWKPIRKGSGSTMYYAATQLHPFGRYKVASYRYTDGTPKKEDDSFGLASLVGSNIYLLWDRISIGKLTCYSPSFEHRSLSNDEFLKKIGSSARSFGIDSNKIEALFIQCTSETKYPSFSVFLPTADAKYLMLWEGVFVSLERADEGSPFLKLLTN
jgi:hypothetical protein